MRFSTGTRVIRARRRFNVQGGFHNETRTSATFCGFFAVPRFRAGVTPPEVAFNHGATERVDFLRKLRALAEAAGVDARVTVQRGPVVEIILLHARAGNADLIVLGTRRKKGAGGCRGGSPSRC